MNSIYKKNKLLPFIFLLIQTHLWGQIQITFPTTRMVFQRSQANEATIKINGHFSQQLDRVEARLVPMVSNQGSATNWQTIQNNPQGGFFSGNIRGTGGWYSLQVRGIVGITVVAETDIERVGIGEVFLIAGQSNATGLFNSGSPNPIDDRINTVDYGHISSMMNQMPQPVFSKLTDNNRISPNGRSAWCWGRLGDLLVARLNVPVLFYNAAWDGTAVTNWVESASNIPSPNVYSGNLDIPTGQPYASFRLALNYYTALTGVRSILWLQGEADNFKNTSTSDYATRLKTLINLSRANYGNDIGWVIAKTSYDDIGGVDMNVINGQNQIISSTPKVFSGPNTDVIQVPRPDAGVHFQGPGLITLAEAWNTSLNSSFFSNCTPIQSLYPNIVGTCAGNRLAITVDGTNLNAINWPFGSTGLSATLESGQYQAQIKDGAGNVFYTPKITVPNDLQPNNPSIKVDGRLDLCQGSTVGLISNSTTNNSWSNGATTQRIDVGGAGTYTLTTKNKYNCAISTSVAVNVFNSPPPAMPSISTSGPTTFCQGNQVILTSSNATGYLWSNGEQTASIVVKESGNYKIQALNALGCASAPASVNVVVNNALNVPTVTASGPTTFCQGGNITLSSNFNAGNIWNNGEQATNIVVTQSGTYDVRLRDVNGCEALSNKIVVKVNPTPSTPTITAERPSSFCEGDSTVLAVSNAFSYRWNNSATTRRLTVKNPGIYSVTVIDQNGCSSAPSTTINVQVYNLPTTPTITANRSTTICANEYITLISNNQPGYLWNNGERTPFVTTNASAAYTVRAVSANGCLSGPSNRILVNVLGLPPKPVITIQGSSTICQGQRLVLQSNYDSGLTWSTGDFTKQITVTTANEYKVKYKDPSGCESLFSDPILVKVNALPATPIIVFEKPTTFCSGENTVLSISNPVGNYRWSNGQTTQKATITQAGDYTATVVDDAGCSSAVSQPIKVTINPLPAQPTITVNGPNVICADQSVTLISSEGNSYQWSNQSTARNASINQEGSYTVRTRNQFGCLSPISEPFYVKVNPLPTAPIIVAEGQTTFCDGGQVALRVDSDNSIFWNNNQTSKRIIATQSGNYAARATDANGCQSPFSLVIRVDVKPIPPTPTVKQVGIYTLEATGGTVGTYQWKFNDQTLINQGAFIKASKPGAYMVQVFVKHSPTLTCFSKPSTVAAFIPETTNDGIGIYPNPSMGLVTLESIEDLRDITLSLYDANGQYLQSNTIKVFDERKKFDWSFLQSGTYFIKLESAGFNLVKKIFIAK